MRVSLNEIDAMVRKAFRGAGYHWGEAEEAGKAASWLAQREVAFGVALTTLLEAADGHLDRLRPAAPPALTGNDGQICPVLFGIALADGAIPLEEGGTLPLTALYSPLLLLPFLSQVSCVTGLEISLDTPPLKATISGAALGIHHASLSEGGPTRGTLAAAAQRGGAPPPAGPRSCNAEIPVEAWDALQRFAVRTYVPASEQSRKLGAGAGLTDQD